ncbi:putative phage tail protein [Vibrio phage 466E53-1]|nr:putative phage tail protein [Vibrio phage 466E53-1]
MSDLDNAINSINASAAKAENTATFLDDMSTFDDQSSVTNPNNGQTVASIPKQVKDRTDELFTAAESDINQAVADAAQSATDAQDAADSIGRYQGLWPDTVGIADKGDTYQTQVNGSPTGRYFTALQNTTVDPVGDDVNWRSVVSTANITDSQSSLLGGGLYKGGNGLFIRSGDTIPAGVSYVQVLIGNEIKIIKPWSEMALPVEIASVPPSDNGQNGYDIVTANGTFEFVTDNIAALRGENPFAITSPLGYGAVTYDSVNVVDSYAAIQRCFDESKNKTVYLGQWFYSSQGLLTPDSASYNEYGFKLIGCNSGDAGVIFPPTVLRGLSLRQMPVAEADLKDPANYTYTGTIERNIHLEDFSLWSEGFTKPALSRGLFLYYTSMLTVRNVQTRGFEVGTDLWCWASTIQSVRNRDSDVGFNYWTGTTTTIISPYSGDCRLGYRIGGKDDTNAGDLGYPIARPITLTFISPAADAITEDAYYINDSAGVEFISPSNEGSNNSMFNIRKTNAAVVIRNPVHAALPAFPTSKYLLRLGAGYNRQVSLSGFSAQLSYSESLFHTEATGDRFLSSTLRLENFFDLQDNDVGNLKIDFGDGVSNHVAETDTAKITTGNCYIDVQKRSIGFGREPGAVAYFQVLSVISELNKTSKTFTKANVMMYSGDGLNISAVFVDSIESRNFIGDGTAMTISAMSGIANQSGDVVRFNFTIPAPGYQGVKHDFKIKMIDEIDWPLNFNN